MLSRNPFDGFLKRISAALPDFIKQRSLVPQTQGVAALPPVDSAAPQRLVFLPRRGHLSALHIFHFFLHYLLLACLINFGGVGLIGF
ncbi:hypothetical protein [Chromobacterium sphagni]|uniref:hypothetical protein n=1 Tax=Chromobacterium sphagni TaxID=1903179 RepID=UPI001113735B|nr:hypothetical protein [Chromobacterium sphagni]